MGTEYKLTPIPRDKPKRWRKKDNRLPKGIIYFPIRKGETKEQSYRRCWKEWLGVQSELNRQGPTQAQLERLWTAIKPKLRTQEEYEGEMEYLTETWAGVLTGDLDVDAVLSCFQPTDPDVPTIRQELDTQHKAKQRKAASKQLAEKTADRFNEKLKHFAGWIGPNLPITAITSAKLLEYHDHLAKEMDKGKRTYGGAKEQQATIIHFVRTAYHVSETLPDLPKIIGQNRTALRFTPPIGTPSPRDTANWHDDLDTLVSIVKNSPDRTRLFIFLMLNCGYQQTDIAELGQNELRANQIVERKRCKSLRQPNAPAVTYTLWPETMALIKTYQAGKNAPKNRKGHPRLLATENNTPLLITSPKADNINRSYQRVLDKMELSKDKRKPPAALRKTSATILEHSLRLTDKKADYSSVAGLFLGQAPTTVKGKHYAPDDMIYLQEALEWLGRFYRERRVII